MLNRNIKAFIISALIIAIILPTQIGFVHSSVGWIRVNSTSVSNQNIQVTAGDNVNLYFGDSSIKWSGQNFYLLLSKDLAITVTSGDHIYSPKFSVAALQASKVSYDSNSEGTWVIGNNWINGTFASSMTAGQYSVKAFDFSGPNTETDTASVAVTDTLITVNKQTDSMTFQIMPNQGPGGIPVQFSGSGYPSNVTLDINYYDSVDKKYKTWTRTTTDATGSFSLTAAIPDLGKSNRQGDTPETFNLLQFQVQYQGLTSITAGYSQYARGIKSIGTQIAYGLYGNGSDLTTTFKAKSGDQFTISGRYFHPGDVAYVLLDSETTVGTVMLNQWNNAKRIGNALINNKGEFNVEVTIPKTISGGEHYIALEDSQGLVILKILITDGSFQVSPSSGPGGANIQFTGSGYPPLSSVDIKYQDGLYGSWNLWTTVPADASGNINITHEIPDLKRSGYAGDYYNSSSQIMFRTEVTGRIYAYTAYTQFARGLKQVGNQIANGLFGDCTNFGESIKVKPGDSLTISGRYFHPGVIYARWDGQNVITTITPDQWANAEKIGTTVANTQGSFDITISIPQQTYGGLHWVSIEDTQTNFMIKIYVDAATAPTPSPTPTNPSSTSPGSGSSTTPKPSSPPAASNKITPTINLQGRSIPIDTGYRVEISGTCTSNSRELTNMAIQLYNSKDGGKTWEPLSMVNTNAEGKFNAVWVSLTSGTFLIKAESTATTEYNSATATVNLAIEPTDNTSNGGTVFTVTSNSTISQLIFNSNTTELSFTATGTTGTTGYVSVNIPKTLINDLTDLKVYLDGNELTYISAQDQDTWFITFTYSHSTHTITMNFANNNQTQNTPDMMWIIAIAIAIIGLIAAVTIFAVQKKKHR
ncbi:MAG: hypothetical protein FWC14_00965 [Candidatus Bathyarchaeota archaeon]|uniref:hypothetical protein n=2 Tax=Candidatus Bathycorpusculum sp. TaxID=2994959 RepID=UPI0028364CDD|nr:hypothetical protein [Candidatus Termiticorpusculum sp.]MCL2293168.1 hypothetical protein [Candidatus Termiticorpusculum sp.]